MATIWIERGTALGSPPHTKNRKIPLVTGGSFYLGSSTEPMIEDTQAFKDEKDSGNQSQDAEQYW